MAPVEEQVGEGWEGVLQGSCSGEGGGQQRRMVEIMDSRREVEWSPDMELEG